MSEEQDDPLVQVIIAETESQTASEEITVKPSDKIDSDYYKARKELRYNPKTDKDFKECPRCEGELKKSSPKKVNGCVSCGLHWQGIRDYK